MVRMWKVMPLAFGLIALVVAANCGTDHAQVRFVHASPPGTPNLDVAVDGKTVVTDLAFDTVSPASGYLTVTAGSRRVEMRDTGTTTDEINSAVSVAAGKAYTLIASGLQASIAAVLLTDDHSAPANGNVKLRIVHVSPSVPPVPPDTPGRVDIYIVAPGTDITGMSPTIAGLAYTQASSYQVIAVGSTEVIVTKTTDQNPMVDQTYDLASGQNRTLVLLDNGSPTTASLLELSDLN